MSLLGKILLVFNMLGAGGLGYMAILGYNARVTWTQAVFRHDLMIDGLPLSDEDSDPRGNPFAEDLTTDLLKDVFNNAGQPVKTQVAEVKRVQDLLESKINALPSPGPQAAEYARVLLPFASTNLQRDVLLAVRTHLVDPKSADALKAQLNEAVGKAKKILEKEDNKLKFDEALTVTLQERGGEPARPFEDALYKQLAATPNKPVAAIFDEVVLAQHTALKSQFETMFRDAKEPKKTLPESPNDPKYRPREDHRAVIAHLLFNLVEVLPPAGENAQPLPAVVRDLFEHEAYRRVFAVVGLQSAIKEINNESLVLAGLRSELIQEIARERSAFALAHTQVLSQLQDISVKVDRARLDVTRAQDQANAQTALVNKRKKDVEDAEQQMAAARKVTATRFKDVVEMRNALFNIRIEVREATVANQTRARKIAELEQKATADGATPSLGSPDR